MHHLRPLLLLVAVGLLAAAEPVLLAPGPVPAKDLGTVLPGGAMLHVQLDGLEHTVASLDDLVMSFVPEAMLPPQFKDLLTAEEPTLAFLGQVSVGMPLDKSFIGRLTGIGGTGALGFTLYPPRADAPRPGPAWVLSLPVADFRALTGILLNVFRAPALETVEAEGTTLYLVRGRNRDLPRVVTVICGPDRVYCCDSAATARRLLATDGDRLASARAIGAALATARPGAGFVAVDFGFAREQIDQLARRFPEVPDRLFDEARPEITRALYRAPQLMFLLQTFGIQGGPDSLVSQAEAWIQGAYGALVPEVVKLVHEMDGFYVGAGLEGSKVDLRVVAVGSALTPEDAPEAVDKAAVAAVLDRLPAPNALVDVSGRARPPRRSSLWAAILEKVREEHVARRVSTRLVDLLRDYSAGCRPVPAVEGIAPWTVRAGSWLPAGEGEARRFGTDLMIQPGGVDAVKDFYAGLVEIENANHGQWRQLQAGLLGDAGWIHAETRCAVGAGAAGTTAITLERSYRTGTGLLGYSQHEFINRLTWLAREQDGLVLVERAEGDGAGWTGPAPLAKVEAPYWRRLLAEVPDGAGQFQLVHALHVLPHVLERAAGMEQVLRGQLDAYLAQVDAVYQEHRHDKRRLAGELGAVPMPLLAAALHYDADGQRFYLRLPVLPLAYPRPPVVPVLRDLFKDVLPRIAEVGGGVSWIRAEPGRLEGGASLDLAGAALLVRGVGNRFAAVYGQGPAGYAKFVDSLKQPLDDMGPHGRVRVNPLWAPLLQALEHGPRRRW